MVYDMRKVIVTLYESAVDKMAGHQSNMAGRPRILSYNTSIRPVVTRKRHSIVYIYNGVRVSDCSTKGLGSDEKRDV